MVDMAWWEGVNLGLWLGLGQTQHNTNLHPKTHSAIPLHHGELSIVWHSITRQPSLRCHISSTQ
jgi:hypothetical protein